MARTGKKELNFPIDAMSVEEVMVFAEKRRKSLNIRIQQDYDLKYGLTIRVFGPPDLINQFDHNIREYINEHL